MDQKTIEQLIAIAQKEADKAIRKGNPPFGAVLADEQGRVIQRAHNTQVSSSDPTAHAEINLLRKAGKRFKTCDLGGYHLFSNAESCSMCLSAGIKANIRHYYFGAPHEPSLDPDLPAGEVARRAKHKIHLTEGILADSCIRQIQSGRSQKGVLLS